MAGAGDQVGQRFASQGVLFTAHSAGSFNPVLVFAARWVDFRDANARAFPILLRHVRATAYARADRTFPQSGRAGRAESCGHDSRNPSERPT